MFLWPLVSVVVVAVLVWVGGSVGWGADSTKTCHGDTRKKILLMT